MLLLLITASFITVYFVQYRVLTSYFFILNLLFFVLNSAVVIQISAWCLRKSLNTSVHCLGQAVAAQCFLHLWSLKTESSIYETLILTTERSFFMVSELQNVWYSWLDMEIRSIAWKNSYADSVTFFIENSSLEFLLSRL